MHEKGSNDESWFLVERMINFLKIVYHVCAGIGLMCIFFAIICVVAAARESIECHKLDEETESRLKR